MKFKLQKLYQARVLKPLDQKDQLLKIKLLQERKPRSKSKEKKKWWKWWLKRNPLLPLKSKDLDYYQMISSKKYFKLLKCKICQKNSYKQSKEKKTVKILDLDQVHLKCLREKFKENCIVKMKSQYLHISKNNLEELVIPYNRSSSLNLASWRTEPGIIIFSTNLGMLLSIFYKEKLIIKIQNGKESNKLLLFLLSLIQFLKKPEAEIKKKSWKSPSLNLNCLPSSKEEENRRINQ